MLLDQMAVATHAGEHDTVLPAVVFDHVSFAFDDHVVLRDVSFTIPFGGATMLLGASGSG
jgi:ABC-type multidrug transport system fused ATPase/permease subunit